MHSLAADHVRAAAREKAGEVVSSATPAVNKKVYMPLYRRRVIPAIVGAVLILAAAVKGYQVLSGRAIGSVWFSAALVQLELTLGLALVVGLWPRYTRILALLVFAAFLGVAFQHAVSGAKSCGCMGDIPLQPWYAFSFDLLSLLGLWLWQPGTQSTGRDSGKDRARKAPALMPRLTSVLSVAVCLPLFLLVVAWKAPSLENRLDVEPSMLELGRVRQQERRELMFRVRNRGEREITIHRWNVSCPCLEVRSAPQVVESGKEVQILLTFDSGKEPGFTGKLRIEVAGRGLSDEIVFTTWVEVEVVPDQGGAI